MPKPLIAGNWKMNGVSSSLAEVEKLISCLEVSPQNVEVLLCPPATLLDRMTAVCENSMVQTGAQDCHFNASGAHTGDISVDMISDAGGQFVIVGHSERRTDHGETSEIVKSKALAVLEGGLTPIICIGETLEQREAGKTLDVLDEQISASIPEGVSGNEFVVAYEPVWAIGTGLTPEIADIDTAHNFMRSKLKELGVRDFANVRLLYGGSVKPGNASEIMAVTEVNGALVGGASLTAKDFLGIVHAV